MECIILCVIRVQTSFIAATWINEFSVTNPLYTLTQFRMDFVLHASVIVDSSAFSFFSHLFISERFLWDAKDCSLISVYTNCLLSIFSTYSLLLPNHMSVMWCGVYCCRFVRTKCDKSSPNVDFIRFWLTYKYPCHRWWWWWLLLSSKCALHQKKHSHLHAHTYNSNCHLKSANLYCCSLLLVQFCLYETQMSFRVT